MENVQLGTGINKSGQVLKVPGDFLESLFSFGFLIWNENCNWKANRIHWL